MQTFLPFPDFEASARALDRARLGKQRVEAWQILLTLRGFSSGWKNHPAVRMWRGHEVHLVAYTVAACLEWRSRGYRDSILLKLPSMAHDLLPAPPPPWLGDERFHLSHRSNLVRKDPGFYGALFPGVPSDLPYFWPVV